VRIERHGSGSAESPAQRATAGVRRRSAGRDQHRCHKSRPNDRSNEELTTGRGGAGRNVRIRIALIVAVLCVAQGSARAGDGNAALALRLVSAMGVDLQMALGVRSIGEQMFRTGQLGATGRDCLRNVDRTAFTALLQESAVRELSVSELRAAIDYFESDAGRKDLWIAEYRRSVARADAVGLRMPDFSPAEYDAMRAFGSSSAGVKLLARGVLTQSDAATDEIVRKTRELIGVCRGAR